MDGRHLADLSTLRRRRNTWGRTILSVFVLSWLSVAVQPCLMAMESDAGILVESGHSAHVMHDGHTANPDNVEAGLDCEHCPPSACESSASCDIVMSSDCQPDVQCSLNNRRTDCSIQDAPTDPPDDITQVVDVAAFADMRKLPTGIEFLSFIPGDQPPLNLLNCVYLI
jgi:hypothetical protein